MLYFPWDDGFLGFNTGSWDREQWYTKFYGPFFDAYLTAWGNDKPTLIRELKQVVAERKRGIDWDIGFNQESADVTQKILDTLLATSLAKSLP